MTKLHIDSTVFSGKTCTNMHFCTMNKKITE